ncbi:MAG: type I methionyl aminopeptidase [Clostridia bacterium]|nr:type I methionyl aminopeptidase [Clostridia bacterium]
MFEKLSRNTPCWCGSGKKLKQCHWEFDEKVLRFEKDGFEVPSHRLLKNPEQIEKIRQSSKVNIACLDNVGANIHEGMALSEIEQIVLDTCASMGAVSAELYYEGYPYAVCTSVNEEVCHGFPHKDYFLKEGDIVNVDCSTILDGYYSDSSRMFCIGDVGPAKRLLVRTVEKAVELAIEKVQPWHRIGEVCEVIGKLVQDNGFTIVPDIGGHGCGLEFHEDPYVNFTWNAREGMLMVPGMIFTIEPMVNMGRPDHITDQFNAWEVYTADGKPSAQREVMVLVTETGHEVLTW